MKRLIGLTLHSQANPKQIKKPQKAGFINFKQNKKKKFEPKWFVLKDKDLIYWKTQNVSHCRYSVQHSFVSYSLHMTLVIKQAF
jgi:hypothetical protein